MTFPHISRGVITVDGDWSDICTVSAEWADVSMLTSWLEAREAHSNHWKGETLSPTKATLPWCSVREMAVGWRWSRLMCSDNYVGSSKSLRTNAQSNSIRLSTKTSWVHFNCFSFCSSTWLWGTPGDCLLNFYEVYIPLRYHLRTEATVGGDCWLNKRHSLCARGQECQNESALIKPTWRMWPGQESIKYLSVCVPVSPQE